MERAGKLQKNLPHRGRGTARRRWMRRGTTLRIVGTMGAEVKHIEKPTLALPLGELSPQVTERALQRFLNENVHLNHQRWPSQSRLCRASSPKGRAKGTFLRIRLLFLQCFTLPRASSVSPAGRASFPTGEAFVPCRGAQRINSRCYIRNVPLCDNKNALESYCFVRFKSVFCILNPSRRDTASIISQLSTVHCQLKNTAPTPDFRGRTSTRLCA